ncbi:RNA polymerase sigma factor [Aquimarina sp. W85]|uniref:RNA polymerase sigma factor n=1 Tax=Aquimarina rhodophyticola TaxID=3342246 RepID=UPI00366BA82A
MKEEVFLKLTNSFSDKLYRIAKRLLISNEEAEDALQEVLLKLWKRKKTISNYKSPEALAITMTKNYCYDKLKAKASGTVKIEHSNYTDRQASLQQEIEAKNSMEWVHKIIDSLPEQQKLVIQLRDIEQFNTAEVAAMLTMNENSVRVALSRGRKALREELIKKQNYGIV